VRKPKEKHSLRESIRRAAEQWDLPQDVLLGLSHIELEGDRELLIDHHQGIIEYTAERVQVATREHTLRIEGSELQLVAMNATQLRLRGTVSSLSLLK